MRGFEQVLDENQELYGAATRRSVPYEISHPPTLLPRHFFWPPQSPCSCECRIDGVCVENGLSGDVEAGLTAECLEA